jgi:hypothetical protein
VTCSTRKAHEDPPKQRKRMKKSKLKSLLNTARKSAEKEINASVTAALKEITGQYGPGSKKLDKRIQKGAKQLSKELSKAIKLDKSLLIQSSDLQEVAKAQPYKSDLSRDNTVSK